MKTKEELQLELNSLKGKHKIVYTIEAPLNDEETEFATIYLKKPDRMIYAMVSKLATGNDPLKAVEACLKSCYIGGDELSLITQNDEALMSCETPIVEMLRKKEAVLKKN
jgi:hypothetical protein